MKKQLSTLQQLIEIMDPELFRHLQKVDGLNLFFCFRYVFCSSLFCPINLVLSWVLIAFKREFPFDDVLRLWEVLWTDYYTHGFVLFVALAVLESHRDMILRYLVEFDEILKVIAKLSLFTHTDVVYIVLQRTQYDHRSRLHSCTGGSSLLVLLPACGRYRPSTMRAGKLESIA